MFVLELFMIMIEWLTVVTNSSLVTRCAGASTGHMVAKGTVLAKADWVAASTVTASRARWEQEGEGVTTGQSIRAWPAHTKKSGIVQKMGKSLRQATRLKSPQGGDGSKSIKILLHTHARTHAHTYMYTYHTQTHTCTRMHTSTHYLSINILCPQSLPRYPAVQVHAPSTVLHVALFLHVHRPGQLGPNVPGSQAAWKTKENA